MEEKRMEQLRGALLGPHEVRRAFRQKTAFIAWARAYAEGLGVRVTVEESGRVIRSRNLVFGDADRARTIITAHYDTCAWMPTGAVTTPGCWPLLVLTELAQLVLLLPLLAIMFFGVSNPHTANDNTSGVIALLEAALVLPEERRGEVAFVWFDNEESGLFGSSAFAQKHKDAAKNTLLVNFDCVSDGDTFLVVLPHRMKDEPLADVLRASFMPHGGKEAVFPTTKRAVYPSDQVRFRRGVGVAALKRGKLGLYLDRIHTKEDTAFDETNIACCVDGMLRLAERV